MFQTILSRIFWILLLTFLQVVIFNHVHILGYATPLPYIYALIILPSNTPRWLYILIGFCLGLCIDTFTNTPGIAAAATTASGLVVPWLLVAFGPKDLGDDDTLRPNHHTMKWGPFLRYAFCAVTLQCTLFFTIEAFSFFAPLDLLFNILGSIVLTMIFIVILELIRNER